MVEPYLRHPTPLYGMLLNKLSTGTILPLPFVGTVSDFRFPQYHAAAATGRTEHSQCSKQYIASLTEVSRRFSKRYTKQTNSVA
jgi:hypothetical protein